MIQIVTADKERIEDALDLRREMLAVVNGNSPEYYMGDFTEKSRDYFLHGDQITVLAYDGNTAIGCATVCFVRLMPTFSRPTGIRTHIMNVYTRANYRRQGIARRMVNELISAAKQRGATQITLDATESGMPLYKSLGFAESEEHLQLDLF